MANLEAALKVIVDDLSGGTWSEDTEYVLKIVANVLTAYHGSEPEKGLTELATSRGVSQTGNNCEQNSSHGVADSDTTVAENDTKKSDPCELKPCPFCGGEAKLVEKVYSWVSCPKCAVHTFSTPNKSEAIAAWNRRSQRASRDDIRLALDNIGAAISRIGFADNALPQAEFQRLVLEGIAFMSIGTSVSEWRASNVRDGYKQALRRLEAEDADKD